MAAAADDTVLTVTSAATVAKKLTAANLTGTGNSFGAQLLHLRYTQTSGTNGGAGINLVWTKYPLNSVTTNEISGATLVSSVISLPAGTYDCIGSAVMTPTNGAARLRLRNTTAGTSVAFGISSYAAQQEGAPTISGRFIIASTSNVELQYFWGTSGVISSQSLGFPANSGDSEIFGEIKIWKVL